MAGDGRTLVRNGLSLAGIAIVSISALLFLIVFFLDLFGFHTNPYLGIIFFLIAPAIFIFGLVLIPIGMFFERRRRAAGHPARVGWPRLDLNNPVQRRGVFIVLVMTFVNVVIISLAAYRGIEFMDSTSFCGQVCHEVMEPEFMAYQDGPHSRISCVQCHIGPGAPYLVKAKIDGVRQVFAVLMDSHSRPIPSPVHTLRPAREVCEQCHWPEKFHGDTVQVKREYADDEAVTESTTTLRIHVGGGSEKLGVATGIHWHMNVANVVEYRADPTRMTIPWIKVTDRTGAVREYVAEGVPQEELDKLEQSRTMDCMDCHNRPSHAFFPSPERAVDAAIAGGELSRGLPFIRREAVAALKTNYADRPTAEREIAGHLTNFYRTSGKAIAQPDLERAIQATQRLYARNVFPGMNVTWGTYPNHIGHMDAPGCFRCHDDNHKTRDGRVIKQDCDLCHQIE
jgi:nitrate/TMAO reductase-like tetraheme cytochrome c subunit